MNRTKFIINTAIVLSPILLFLVLIQVQWGATVYDFRSITSDEIFIWHQAQAFSEVGMNSGYYTIDEQGAPWEQSRFYSWGLGRPIYLGIVASLFGWELFSVLILNIVLLLLAGFIFVHTHIHTPKQQVFLFAFLMLFPSIWLYLGSGLIQSMQLAFAWLWVSLFLSWQKRIDSNFRLVILLIHTTIMALLNIPLAMLFVVITFVKFNHTRSIVYSFSMSLFLSAIVVLSMAVIYYFTSAPYPDPRFYIIEAIRQDTLDGLNQLLEYGVLNLTRITEASIEEVIPRIAYLSLMIVCSIQMLRSWRNGNIKGFKENVLFFLILLPPFIFTLFSNDFHSWKDFRIFSPFMLIVFMILLDQKRFRHATVLIVLYAVILPQNIDHFSKKRNFDSNVPFENYYAQSVEEYQNIGLVYEPEAQSPWCNTYLTTVPYLDRGEYWLSTPTGIGLSFISRLETAMPLRSRYLLLGEQTYEDIIDSNPKYDDAFIVHFTNETEDIWGRVSNEILLENKYPDCKEIFNHLAVNQDSAYLPVEYILSDYGESRFKMSGFEIQSWQSDQMSQDNDISYPLVIPDVPFWQRPVNEQYNQLVFVDGLNQTINILPALDPNQAQYVNDQLQNTTSFTSNIGEAIGQETTIDTLEFMAWQQTDTPIARFDNTLEILNVEIPDTVVQGEWIPITFRLRITEPTNKLYYLGLQVWDLNQNRIDEQAIAQDLESGQDQIFYYAFPTVSWQPNQIIETVRHVRIPDDKSIGGYQIMALPYHFNFDLESPVVYAEADAGSQSQGWVRVATTGITPDAVLSNPTLPIINDDVIFDNRIMLRGVENVRSNETYTISFDWLLSDETTETDLNDDLILFIHALDENQNIVAQLDEMILQGIYPTSFWRHDEVYRSNHTLTTSENVASFAIGLYRLDTLERVTVTIDDEIINDRVYQIVLE